MLKKLQKDNKGFTIIEVMIVLAIAGLILLIVFLAVPALQRSSRNTQRKNDAAAVSGALGTYISNNNGALPISLGKNASTSTLELCAAAGDTVGDSKACTGNVEQAKLGFYTADQIHFETNTSAGLTFTAAAAYKANTNVSKDSAVVVTKGTCSDTTGKVDYSARSAVVLYVTESGGSSNGSIQCTEQ